MKIKEFIICAAIWIKDGEQYEEQPEGIDNGYVICGRRHHNCYQTITILKGDCNEYLNRLNLTEEDYRDHQGFVTSTNRYVNRKEAWKIALENNHLYMVYVSLGDESILISENLW